jgi:ankyrin repeat protein
MQLRSLFSDTDQLLKRRFPVLHKIVLGLIVKRIEDELQASTSTINATDLDGRTALSWAAARNDVEAVRILLKYGADPNIQSNDGFAPLHWAARAMDAQSLISLVQFNANVDCRTSHGSTPLHQAALFQDSPDFMKPLIDAGTDIHARRSNGDSPLICAAEENHPSGAAYLLDRGANIEDMNHDGSSALFWAISNNCHETLSLLLARCANYRLIMKNGDTVLHIVAKHADIATVQILAAGDLMGIDKAAKGTEELTAIELAARRADLTEEWDVAFNLLLESIRYQQVVDLEKPLAVVETIEVEGVDEFFDAVEYQTPLAAVAILV